MLGAMKRMIQRGLAYSIGRLGALVGVTASIAAMGLSACTPEERQFEPTGSGAGGAGGAGGGMVCVPDETRSCYTGAAGTEGMGLCKAGVEVCLPNGSGFGECGGAVVPQVEDCLTTEDEACNGVDPLECPSLGDGWLKTYGEPFSPQNIADLAVGPDGNIVVVGSFGNVIDLGAGPMASTGSFDILVAKFTPKGELVWAKRFGDAAPQEAFAVAIDTTGAIYVGGAVAGSVDFGDGIKTSVGADDAFIAKFDANGNADWSKLFGSAASQKVHAIGVTKANQVVIAGNFAGTINFGGATFTSAGLEDGFLAKFDETGFHAASRRFGGMGTDDVRAMAIDDVGQVYLTGTFKSLLEFGPGQSLAGKGARDVFAVQFSSAALAPIWFNGWGDASDQEAFDVAVAPNGDLYLAGAFAGGISFFNSSLESPDLAARPMYVARIASSLDAVVWAKSFGDATAIVTQGLLAVGASDQLVLAGSFQGGMDFGGGVLTAVEFADLFFAKVGGDGAHVASRVLLSGGEKGNDAPNTIRALTLLPAGDLMVGGQHRAPFLINDMLVGGFDAKDGNAFLGRFLP